MSVLVYSALTVRHAARDIQVGRHVDPVLEERGNKRVELGHVAGVYRRPVLGAGHKHPVVVVQPHGVVSKQRKPLSKAVGLLLRLPVVRAEAQVHAVEALLYARTLLELEVPVSHHDASVFAGRRVDAAN